VTAKEEFNFYLEAAVDASRMPPDGERAKLYCLVLKRPNGEQCPCPWPFFSMREAARYLTTTCDLERAERENLSFELMVMLSGTEN
jgi:hypothetical protein